MVQCDFGQCNACPPSLLVKRLLDALGHALVDVEVNRHGVPVPIAQVSLPIPTSTLGPSAASSASSLSFPQAPQCP